MKKLPLLHHHLDGRDYLLPHERTWRAVWSTFRWRELLTALGAAGWLFGVWVWWHCDPARAEGGQSAGQRPAEELRSGVHAQQGKGGGE